MIPGFKLTEVGELLRPSLRIQEEDHNRAERHMQEMLVARKARHQQLYGITYPNTNVPLKKSRPFRIFDLSLHQSVTHDILYTLRHLYGDIFEYINWNISLHNFFDAPSVDVEYVNEETWGDLSHESIKQFQGTYDTLLQTVDIFIVGHAPILSLLFEKYEKPILILNTCRYNQPFCWFPNPDFQSYFHRALTRMSLKRQAIIVSNNCADHAYLKDCTGLGSIYIPSLCLYQEPHKPVSKTWLLYSKELEEHLIPLATGTTVRLLPRPPHFDPSDIAACAGVIHLPYDISSISLSEQYMSGLPIFVPSISFLKKCIHSKVINFIAQYDKWNETLTDGDLDMWLIHADYYLLPNIITYDSFEDCIKKVVEFQDADRERRLQDIRDIQADAFKRWAELLDPYLRVPIVSAPDVQSEQASHA